MNISEAITKSVIARIDRSVVYNFTDHLRDAGADFHSCRPIGDMAQAMDRITRGVEMVVSRLMDDDTDWGVGGPS